jgi:hypothetical protein
MSLTKYLQTINQVDPGKIYVENIRSILKTSQFRARLICEQAVIDNLFLKKIGVICPSCDRIVASYFEEDNIPETHICELCEMEEKDEFMFRTVNMDQIIFYQLNKE